MKVYEGKSVFNGIAIGKIKLYLKGEQQVKRHKVTDVKAELLRYEEARNKSMTELKGLYEKALKEVGEANAAIFEVHQMMLEDEDYNESVRNIIESQGVNAEYAVAATGDNFSKMFSSMEDEYMKERAADVKDISERVISVLNGKSSGNDTGDEASIIVADDLAPSETVQLDKDKVLSFVTVHGSLNSHTAILARTMAIPALVDTPLPLDEEIDGVMAVVDGTKGVIYIDPDCETLELMKKRKAEEDEKRVLLQTLKGKDNITVDGQKIMLYANIGNIKDLAKVIQNDAGGIGLFRSEFIYLESKDFPTEEEQFMIYRQVAETMAGKKVIIRTLDIGADKQCDYFNMAHEDNPAMGCRAIRICLTRPEIFKTQLRALYRASAYGNIAIMYPMITSVWEVKRIKEIADEVRKELDEQGILYGNPEQGIMIETPAAVMISDELAKEVDFFSIGTNDLTQYTLAIDRQNTELDMFYDSHHPAVLKMISMVIDNAHKAGIWAGICGELGADQSLTKEFLAMGVDELSVSPGSVLPIRKIVIETNVKDYKAKKMLTKQRHEEMINIIRERGSITTNEMAKILGISESTARRDINFLADTGKVIKVYGGAMFDPQDVDTKEDSFEQRMDINATEKGKAAEKALELITPDDFIYIDAGTTTKYIADNFNMSGVRIVTNGIEHARILASKGNEVVLVGGNVKISTDAIVGTLAVNTLDKYHFTKGFFGTNGISPKAGYTTPDINEALVKKAAMQKCSKSFIVCDSSKFNTISAVTFASFREATIVTNLCPAEFSKYKNIIVY